MAVHTSDFRIEAEMGKSWGFRDQSASGSWETLKSSNRAGHLLSVRFRSIGTHAREGTCMKTHAHTVKVVFGVLYESGKDQKQFGCFSAHCIGVRSPSLECCHPMS